MGLHTLFKKLFLWQILPLASFLLIKSSHVHILCKYYFLTSLGKARAKLLSFLLTFFFGFLFFCFFVFIFLC